MIIVVDTNVLFQGLDTDKGASFRVLELVFQSKVTLALSYPVVCEYEEVLKRKENLRRLQFSEAEVDEVLAFLTYVCKPVDPSFLLRPNLRDDNDNLFVELAFVANADYLLTQNIRDFTYRNELKIDSFEVTTPSEFMKTWRKK